MDLRNRTIIRYGAAGVIMNLLLSVAKFIFGNLINSRAILMDAWNGFSDMVSSVLSILSAAYASKRVDREHPLGFGRLEYVTSMFSTVFIVFMGLRGICGTNLNEAHNAELWDRILAHIGDHPEFIRAYAFSYDAEERLAYFYVVPDVAIRKNKDAAVAKLRAELEEEFPDIVFSIDTSVEM